MYLSAADLDRYHVNININSFDSFHPTDGILPRQMGRRPRHCQEPCTRGFRGLGMTTKAIEDDTHWQRSPERLESVKGGSLKVAAIYLELLYLLFHLW